MDPNIIETWEDEPSGVTLCPACDWEMIWTDCDLCGGEGYFDWETLQEQDPLWYQPDDTERCEQCSGRGGWWWCDNPDCPRKASEER